MKVQVEGDTLTITGIKELAAANSQSFRNQVRSALKGDHRNIQIDLSQTMFVDSCGLSALVSLRKDANSRHGCIRLLNPTPPVYQILELTRMHRIFEIIKNQACLAQ
jgi:anti-sigma B factor antagonist